MLEGWTAPADDCGGVVVAGADRVGVRGWREQRRVGCAAGGAPQHGVPVAPAVRGVRLGWSAGSAATGAAAEDHRRACRGGDHQDAGSGAEGRDALVDAIDGRRGRALADRGLANLASVRAQAPRAGHLETVEGSVVRGQAPRRRRARTSTRPNAPSCCAWTRSPRSRRWIGPEPILPMRPGYSPARDARVQTARHEQPLRGTGPHRPAK